MKDIYDWNSKVVVVNNNKRPNTPSETCLLELIYLCPLVCVVCYWSQSKISVCVVAEDMFICSMCRANKFLQSLTPIEHDGARSFRSLALIVVGSTIAHRG